MIELLLSFLSDDLSSIFFPAFAFLSGILLIIFMALDSKRRGKSVVIPYYICAFILPVVTAVIYFFTCRKDNKNVADGKKKNAVSIIFGALFCLCYLTAIVFGVYMAKDIADFKRYREEMQAEHESDGVSERIKVQNEAGQFVYYDKFGNEYSQSLMVKIYNEKAVSFDYARFQEFDKDGNESFKGYYLDGSGSKFDEEFCFVDKNGLFVYKKDLECKENTEGKKYFECPYTDSEGNNYYPATLASWDSEGKLILK